MILLSYWVTNWSTFASHDWCQFVRDLIIKFSTDNNTKLYLCVNVIKYNEVNVYICQIYYKMHVVLVPRARGQSRGVGRAINGFILHSPRGYHCQCTWLIADFNLTYEKNREVIMLNKKNTFAKRHTFIFFQEFVFLVTV